MQLFGRSLQQSHVCIKCGSSGRSVATVEFSFRGGTMVKVLQPHPFIRNHQKALLWFSLVPSEPPSFFMAEVQKGSRVDVPKVLHNTNIFFIHIHQHPRCRTPVPPNPNPNLHQEPKTLTTVPLTSWCHYRIRTQSDL